MTLRPRTTLDPPLVDYAVLRQQLEQLQELCHSAHATTRYLPNCDARVDESYKVERMLIEPGRITHALYLARQLCHELDEFERSLVQVVHSPSDLQAEQSGQW